MQSIEKLKTEIIFGKVGYSLISANKQVSKHQLSMPQSLQKLESLASKHQTIAACQLIPHTNVTLKAKRTYKDDGVDIFQSLSSVCHYFRGIIHKIQKNGVDIRFYFSF